MCYQVDVSAPGRSLVQRIPTECGVSEGDHEASIMRRSRPTGGSCTMEEKHGVAIFIYLIKLQTQLIQFTHPPFQNRNVSLQ